MLMQLGANTYTGTMFQFGSINSRNQISDANPDQLFNAVFWLQPEVHKHKRVVFGWMNLLGALGGITNVIMILFNGIIKPINEHSFVLKAAKKLYFARTKKDNLF